MLVNSSVRRGAYWHFIEICLHSSNYNRHLETVLLSVAQRMGLSLTALFHSYASQIAYSIRQVNGDFLRIPPFLFGYRDRKECAQATFAVFTPTNLLGGGFDPEGEKSGRNLFISHCQILKKSRAEGIHECLADTVGQQIAFWISQAGPARAGLDRYLESLVAELGRDVPFAQHLRPYSDGIISSIIRTLGDQDYTHSGPIVSALQEHHGASADVFTALIKFRTKHYLDEGLMPSYGSISVLEALNWFQSVVPHADDEATTFHVLHRLFADLESTPLVLEQVRLLNVISVWIACRHYHFQDKCHLPLLKAVLNGALNVLGQYDLARGAQSIIEWGFARVKDIYRHIKESELQEVKIDIKFSEILLRMACVVYDHYTSGVRDIAEMGKEVMEWVEKQVEGVYSIRHLRKAAVKALSAWPRDLNDTLKQISERTGPEDVSSFLRDDRISTNKFRMVRRLRRLMEDGYCEESQFARSDFWRLKACIPPQDRLLVDDIHSFTELLLINKGHIDGLENEHSTAPTTRSRHLRQFKKMTSQTGVTGVETLPQRRAILISLLLMLDDPSASQVYLAFRTLRSLASIGSTDAAGSISWPKEYHAELSLLKAYSDTPPSISPFDLREVLSSEVATKSMHDPSQWMTFLADALCRVLSIMEPFYLPLLPMLQEDQHFAEEVIPVLVHVLLHREKLQETPSEPTTVREVLSEYFTRVLASNSASTPCRRAVVDTVLHLRYFDQPQTSDPLAYNHWLDIDFVLLSQGAIFCGAYTTALLFIELVPRNADRSQADQIIIEQVLYEIYSHIDEPDGFYAIETQDLDGSLLKRFHHENQWQKAFQFHGAALITRSPETADVAGVLQSLHAFGFEHLAMTTLRNTAEIDDSLNSDAMTYDLGWRTETWDLPEHAMHNKGMSLYLALRAVHRERDGEAISAVVQRSLFREMDRLRMLGDENTTEIREVAQNLLCLNEIRHWQNPDLQTKFREKNLDFATLAQLRHIDQDVE
jgi:serine-protein kinase ATM